MAVKNNVVPKEKGKKTTLGIRVSKSKQYMKYGKFFAGAIR